jgi:hypothetical protein
MLRAEILVDGGFSTQQAGSAGICRGSSVLAASLDPPACA